MHQTPWAEVRVVDLARDEVDLALRLPEGTSRARCVFAIGDAVVGDQLVACEGGLRGPVPLDPEVIRAARRHRVEHAVRQMLAGGAAEPSRQLSLTVVVCTLRRPVALARCLAALQHVRRSIDEVIVVDNDGEDRRPERVAREYGARYLVESQRGLSRARNRGIREAGGELIAFIDDDCEVASGWLLRSGEHFADPLVMGVVGYVGAARFDTEAQWLFEQQGGFHHRFERVVHDGVCGGPWAGAGLGDGNSCFRRSLFAEIGGFAEDLGPGTKALSAQDADLFYRLMSAGYRVVFDPACVAWHHHREDARELAATLGAYAGALSVHAARCLLKRDAAAVRFWRWWYLHHLRRLALEVVRDRSPELRALLFAQAVEPVTALWRARDTIAHPAPPPAVAAPAPASKRAALATIVEELPRIAVAIATRNRRDRLRQTLAALARSRFPRDDVQVVVVLDGCTDDSAEVAASFKGHLPLRVIEQAPAGLATSRNRGVRATDAPVVLLLDDDLVPGPDLLVEHARAHAEGRCSGIVMGYHPARLVGAGWWGMGVRAWWNDHFRRKSEAGHRFTFVDYCDGNSSLPRELFERLGGFDEAFTGGRRQDWELAVRALRHGVPFAMRLSAEAAHHLDPTFLAGLRASRQEGAYDVLLGRKHPQTVGCLPLPHRFSDSGGLPCRLRRLLVSKSAGRLADERVADVADRLERRHLWGRWRRYTELMLRIAYLQGVHDALGSWDELPQLLQLRDEGRDVVRFRLGANGGVPQQWRHVGRVELELGGAVGPVRVPALRAGEGWSTSAVAKRMADGLVDGEGPHASPRALSVLCTPPEVVA